MSEPTPRTRAESRRARRTPSRWRTVRRSLYGVVAFVIIFPVLAFAVAYVSVDVPRPEDLRTNQVATILAADGTSVIGKVVPPEGNRTDVPITAIPEHVRNAVLAAEDRSFYTNPGFSLTGTARATLNNLRGRDTQGGSTITQQYVKNALVGSEQTLLRKMEELVVSTKMARQSSKDEILSAYLNTIYFGRGAYGIAAAAQTYFGKPVEQLTVAEGAVLASSIQSPSYNDPENNPQVALDRWGFVLDGMVSQGWLPAAERATETYPTVLPRAAANDGSDATGPEGLIRTQVLQELSTSGISEQQLNTEGLQITTTIDPKAQAAAVSSAQEVLTGEPGNLRSAVVSVDPRSGAVRAYYGGNDGNGFDYASSTNLQPGSSFKVFVLAAALQKGVALSDVYDGSSGQTIQGQLVNNSDGESCGSCTVSRALLLSINTIFYQITADIGPDAVAAAAHAAGVPTTFPGTNTPTLVNPDGSGPNNGIALGAYETRPIDMAAAYSTFAAQGQQHPPYFVQKVVTADGTVLLDRGTPAGTQAFEPNIANNVTKAMQPIASASRSHGLAGGRPSAAKTGTTQLGDTGENRDAWMVGFTPSLSTAVWVGSPDGTAITNSSGSIIYGSGLPADIWKSTMDGALDGTPDEDFPEAAAIESTQTYVPQTTQAPRRTTQAPVTTQAPTTTTTQAPPTTTTEAPPTTTEPPVTTTAPGAGGGGGGRPTTTAPTTTAPAGPAGLVPPIRIG
ncbi:transglycosylase domain-containing protein [Rhodococcus aerolatus]